MRDLLFLPSFSLQPNKLSSFNSVFIRDKQNEKITSIKEGVRTRAAKFTNIAHSNSITRSSHDFTISDNAFRNLKSKINWLYYLSKSKRIKTYNGKDIFNFKIGFITLTLPSKQNTCTKDVTQSLLNPFLTEIRQRTGMENYVWRLEFQKNGNVHYHIVTDTYIDYHLVKKIWNRLLNSKGYIKPYQDKMNKLLLSDYIDLYKYNDKYQYSDLVKNYARNKRENWSQPNSVDVKPVISNKAIANYISKYFSKDSDENPIKNELDNDENSKNLRLWFCSRSLSKLKSVSNFCEAVEYDIFSIISFADDVKKVVLKYCTMFYFELSTMRGHARKWIEFLLKNYARDSGYIPAT